MQAKISQRFHKGDQLDPRLKWSNMPERMDLGVTSRDKLTVGAGAETDAWCKTYYDPIIDKENVPMLGLEWDGDFSAQTRLQLEPKHQFDQAGLMVRFGPEHWIKAGIEFCDGVARLSVVATNVHSDWTCHGTRDLAASTTVTIHRKGSHFVVSFAQAEMPSSYGSFLTYFVADPGIKPVPEYFARSCSMRLPSNTMKPVVGIYTACPGKNGGLAQFDHLIITRLARKVMDGEVNLLRSSSLDKNL